MLVVQKTDGRLGLQHPSVRGVLLYVVHMIGDSLASSDHNWGWRRRGEGERREEGEGDEGEGKEREGRSVGREEEEYDFSDMNVKYHHSLWQSNHQRTRNTWDRRDFAARGKVKKKNKKTLFQKRYR